MAEGTGILSGIRVIDLGTYIFGPGAATVLSDFGAEVIKVERPGTGDPYRYLYRVPPMPAGEVNYPWLLDNRNKKSLAVDLISSEGREIILRLVVTADVFITNLQPSSLAKLRLSYEDLQTLNDRLVYAHATGYGETGGEIENPGFDMTAFWARSGLMDSIHNADSEPCLSMAGMGDHPSAMSLVAGIMLALFDRQRSGRGTKVSSSLMANGAWANSCLIQAELCGAAPFIPRTRTTAVNALVNHYVTMDNKRFIFCLLNTEKDWPNLCRAISREDLFTDPLSATADDRGKNAAELIEILDRAFAGKTMSEWAEIFASHDLTWSPVSTVDQVARDPQMQANGVFLELDHPTLGHLQTVNSPVTLRGVAKVKPSVAPEIGEHSREILGMLGYSEATIQELVKRGIVQQNSRNSSEA